ncbi:hypothetical protein [Photobacterium kishitanii]|uniref:Uncharacterized protein n=1 Tax=Photobacterium kishitanii TaxID=318456 RepID=A0A2T3KL16_9GAMM|nr:hypothetical protein [Photobacterium kishitanii]PSV00349.1 hypothetical protein C9J27_04275 [Photobacterium kishitanii]
MNAEKNAIIFFETFRINSIINARMDRCMNVRNVLGIKGEEVIVELFMATGNSQGKTSTNELFDAAKKFITYVEDNELMPALKEAMGTTAAKHLTTLSETVNS